MNYEERLYRQLAYDYGCLVEDIVSSDNIFTDMSNDSRRRMFRSHEAQVKILLVNNKIVINCNSELRDLFTDRYADTSAARFCSMDNCRELDNMLTKHGMCIADYHNYYIPVKGYVIPDNASVLYNTDYDIDWYEEEELHQFKGDMRFTDALSYEENAPDMLAVTASDNGDILGMAGASRDSKDMWQIGINVTEAGKGKGIGTLLTTMLKDELIRRNILPYYGMVSSHIKSQRVAIQSGFIPTFAELYTKNVNKM